VSVVVENNDGYNVELNKNKKIFQCRNLTHSSKVIVGIVYVCVYTEVYIIYIWYFYG
jgi:hypothetical protein